MWTSLAYRLEACLSSWPANIAREVRRYLAARRVGKADEGTADRGERYWLLLPVWLWGKYASRLALDQRDRDFLDDVLWGQLALFLCVRLQDDLYDGETACPNLRFAADQFLIESERAYAKHFGQGSAFTEFFRNCVQTSTQAIVEVDRLQREPRGAARRLLSGYARVYAVLKVGAAAVCLRLTRGRELARVMKFADQMAVGCQLLDDLQDLQEDLNRGRINFAARRLLRPGSRPGRVARHRLQRMGENLLHGDGLEDLLDEVRRSLRRADSSLAPLNLLGVKEHMAVFRRSLNRLQLEIQRARVEILSANYRERRAWASRVGTISAVLVRLKQP